MEMSEVTMMLDIGYKSSSHEHLVLPVRHASPLGSKVFTDTDNAAYLKEINVCTLYFVIFCSTL